MKASPSFHSNPININEIFKNSFVRLAEVVSSTGLYFCSYLVRILDVTFCWKPKKIIIV
jgi:hypothetical protein